VIVSRRVDFVPKSHLLNRWKYRTPRRIVAISERIADVMRAFGVSDERLRVVHSGIDASRFDVAPLARASLGVAEDAPLLGNVAALVDHKDQRTLIAAMPAVLQRLPQLRLVIAGEGPLRPALEAQIAALQVGHAVTLLGQRSDVPRLLRTLDAFVLSSKEEGLGTSVLDAMACGLPVIACAGGGIPEMVRDGETGYLVPPQQPAALADAIIRAFTQRDATRAIVQAASARLDAQFTAERMVEGNIAVYDEALREAAARCARGTA
jgi:glycosyltransferase involved in cell wall biosynthesis